MFRKTPWNKMPEKCQSILIHLRVICQYPIGVNRNSVPLLGMCRNKFYIELNVHNLENTQNVQYIVPGLDIRDSDYLPLN